MVKSELNVAKNTLQTIINLSSPISNHFSKSLYALIYFVNKSKIIVLNNFQWECSLIKKNLNSLIATLSQEKHILTDGG